MLGIETERKFLVRNDIDFRPLARKKYKILQGYIPTKKFTLRIRLRDDEGFLTIKVPLSDGFSRHELEKELTKEEALMLLQLCERPLIEKTRYLVDVGNHCFEVDEFAGDNEGLIIAEVELKSESEDFERPDFLGKEVTFDHRFYNSELRRHPFSEWKDDF